MPDPQLDVVVDDIGVDAALIRDADGAHQTLILRPGQSFSNAARAIHGCLPWLHPDAVRRVVRTFLPDAVEFQDVTPSPAGSRPEARPLPGRVARRRAIYTGAAIVLSAGSAEIGYLLHTSPHLNPIPATAWTNPVFRELDRLGVACRPLFRGALLGVCSDAARGDEIQVQASLGPGFIAWSFINGHKRAVMRYDTDLAQGKAAAARAKRVEPNVTERGHYFILGDPRALPQLWDAIDAVPQQRSEG